MQDLLVISCPTTVFSAVERIKNRGRKPCRHVHAFAADLRKDVCDMSTAMATNQHETCQAFQGADRVSSALSRRVRKPETGGVLCVHRIQANRRCSQFFHKSGW